MYIFYILYVRDYIECKNETNHQQRKMSEKEKKQQLGAPRNPLEFVDVRFDDYSDYTSACSSFTS